MRSNRTVFFLSDRTGITAEALGHSLLTQFEGIEWKKRSRPFIESIDAAKAVAEEIAICSLEDGHRPLIFSTLVDESVREIIAAEHCIVYDFFGTFIESMERELKQQSAHLVGKTHGIEQDNSAYFNRIAAVNYTLNNDDGISIKHFSDADIILIGVSRSGKTPTCLYLALQYGIQAANYPLIEEDMKGKPVLPAALHPYRDKLFGLTLSPQQLHRIRQERRPNSRYATIEQCRDELIWQHSLYTTEDLPYVDTTNISIEEISTTILSQSGLKRRLYGA